MRGDVSRTFACRTSHDDLGAHIVGGDSHAAEGRRGKNRPGEQLSHGFDRSGLLGSVASSLGMNSIMDLAEALVDARHVIGNVVTKLVTEGEVTVDNGGIEAHCARLRNGVANEPTGSGSDLADRMDRGVGGLIHLGDIRANDDDSDVRRNGASDGDLVAFLNDGSGGCHGRNDGTSRHRGGEGSFIENGIEAAMLDRRGVPRQKGRCSRSVGVVMAWTDCRWLDGGKYLGKASTLVLIQRLLDRASKGRSLVLQFTLTQQPCESLPNVPRTTSNSL